MQVLLTPVNEGAVVMGNMNPGVGRSVVMVVVKTLEPVELVIVLVE